jgi:hypothetical protein
MFMKLVRFLLIGTAVVAVLAIVAAIVVFTPSFQTWAVHEALARRPGLHLTIGRVDAGWSAVELRDVRFERNGTVLIAPAIEAKLPIAAVLTGNAVTLSRLVAKGWTLSLAKSQPTRANSAPANPATSSSITAAAAAAGFHGVFTDLRLPVDFAADGVQLEGTAVLPGPIGRAAVSVTGGGLQAGHEGKFVVDIRASIEEAVVSSIKFLGNVSAAMDTPRTFTRFAFNGAATATGAGLEHDVTLTIDASATRTGQGESYAANALGAGRELLALHGDFPAVTHRLVGTWKLDLRDADLMPFVPGRTWPTFTAAGNGQFESDPTFTTLHSTGRLDASADQLAALNPSFSGVGPLRVTAAFDFAQRGAVVVVTALDADIVGARPVAHVHAMQSFEFNPESGAVVATDPAHDLIGVSVDAIPLGWIKPFLPDLTVTGADVRGDFAATPRAGGLSIRAISPLVADHVTITRSGKTLLAGVDLSLLSSGDYTPHGWQAEIAAFVVKRGDVMLLSLDAKTGKLAGPAEPIKATGKLVANLAAWAAQPVFAGNLSLSRGEANVEFAASLGATKELQAKLAVTNLVSDSKATPAALPAISATVRADVTADGRIAFNAPISLVSGQRQSDLALTGTIAPANRQRTIEAQISSRQLFITDAKMLAALWTGNTTRGEKTTGGVRETVAPWSALEGVVTLDLKKLVYSDTFEIGDVTGRVRLTGGSMTFQNVQAGTGQGGAATINGSINFDHAAAEPYALTADLALTEFDPGPLFRALRPGELPTVEGRFNVTSRLAGRAKTVDALTASTGGSFELTSKGGVFRGLPVNISAPVEKMGRISGFIASASNAITSLTSKKEPPEIPSRAQAVSEFAKALYPINYDQLHVMVVRDAESNTVLRDFTLISPELRLTGTGQTLHTAGRLLDDSLAMEFRLRARGHDADVLKYLGLLEAQPDNLGYIGCTLPLKVGGTLGKPDASDLTSSLVALLTEKAGRGDKATDFLNKMIGRSPE